MASDRLNPQWANISVARSFVSESVRYYPSAVLRVATAMATSFHHPKCTQLGSLFLDLYHAMRYSAHKKARPKPRHTITHYIARALARI